MNVIKIFAVVCIISIQTVLAVEQEDSKEILEGADLTACVKLKVIKKKMCGDPNGGWITIENACDLPFDFYSEFKSNTKAAIKYRNGYDSYSEDYVKPYKKRSMWFCKISEPIHYKACYREKKTNSDVCQWIRYVNQPDKMDALLKTNLQQLYKIDDNCHSSFQYCLKRADEIKLGRCQLKFDECLQRNDQRLNKLSQFDIKCSDGKIKHATITKIFGKMKGIKFKVQDSKKVYTVNISNNINSIQGMVCGAENSNAKPNKSLYNFLKKNVREIAKDYCEEKAGCKIRKRPKVVDGVRG